MSTRAKAVVFLTFTVLAVGTELLFAFDGDASTLPWTEYLIRLPWWLLVPFALGFAVWLPIHLFLAKRKGRKLTT